MSADPSLSLSPGSQVQRARRYYFESVVFQVEDSLFNVPKWYFIKHSSIFRDMFSVPIPAGEVVDGSSDDRPLVLEGVRADDFEALMGLMYPMLTHDLSGTCEYPKEPVSDEEKIAFYTSILDLSRKWYFHGLHAYAVKRLSGCLSSVNKVAFGKRFGIPAWIVDGYDELITRRFIMTQPEAERLGWKITLEIVHIRETIQKLYCYRHSAAVEAAIRNTFPEDLLQAETAYTEFYADADSNT